MPLTLLPYDLPGQIYRSPMPFSRFDLGASTFMEYQTHQVSVVVMLTSDAEALDSTGQDLRALYQAQGWGVIHLPIPDFGVPGDPHLFSAPLKQVVALANEGANVAIHCLAGIGRTGTFAALLARQVFGYTGDQAIQWVRAHVRGAVEVPQQAQLVEEFPIEP